jgi:hypothetical protein
MAVVVVVVVVVAIMTMRPAWLLTTLQYTTIVEWCWWTGGIKTIITLMPLSLVLLCSCCLKLSSNSKRIIRFGAVLRSRRAERVLDKKSSKIGSDTSSLRTGMTTDTDNDEPDESSLLPLSSIVVIVVVAATAVVSCRRYLLPHQRGDFGGLSLDHHHCGTRGKMKN